jgi:hypothetical protein
MATPSNKTTPKRYTDAEMITALDVILTWFRRAANDVVNRANDASTPARLMWRAFNMPVCGMVAAVLHHSWQGEYGTNPQPWDVSPAHLVEQGSNGMRITDPDSPLANREISAKLSHSQITRAIAQVLGEKIDGTRGEPMSNPTEVLTHLLTPKPKTEKAAKLPEEELKRIKAIMSLASTDDMREVFAAKLTPEGRAELERREKAAAERAAQKQPAPKADSTK